MAAANYYQEPLLKYMVDTPGYQVSVRSQCLTTQASHNWFNSTEYSVES